LRDEYFKKIGLKKDYVSVDEILTYNTADGRGRKSVLERV
jgi:hypothetical protein